MIDGADVLDQDAPVATDAATDRPGAEQDDGRALDAKTGEELDAGERGDGEPNEELENVEFAGKQYRLPRELKSALMMQADYTRKTQEVAEGRKALESEREAFRHQAETHQTQILDVARVVSLNAQLAELQGLDWKKLDTEDPFLAQSKLGEFVRLKDQRDALIGKIQDAEQRRAVETQRALSKRFDDASTQLAREIKDWNTVSGELVEFARANGMSQIDLAQLALNVPAVKLLHKAWIGDQLIRKQKAAAAQAEAEASPQPEPLKQVAKGRGTAATSGLSDALSVEEWVKRRNAQLRKTA